MNGRASFHPGLGFSANMYAAMLVCVPNATSPKQIMLLETHGTDPRIPLGFRPCNLDALVSNAIGAATDA